MTDADEDQDEAEALAEQLHQIVDRMLRPLNKRSPRRQPTFWDPFPLPIDIRKLNEHDSRAEFQREFDAVKGAVAGLDEVLRLMAGRADDDEKERRLRGQLRESIDGHLRQNAPEVKWDDAYSLVRKGVADVGGFVTTLLILLDFRDALDARLKQLEEQQQLFWHMPHRAPDHYARTIALRLAKLYAVETGQRPTLGTSGETGDPSTSFTRALREVFQLLGIETNVRTPAEWAVGRLTDADLQKPLQNALVALMGTRPPNALREPSLLDLLAPDAFERSEDEGHS